jgi:parvulin-like peptidyl-prolyl isomerase
MNTSTERPVRKPNNQRSRTAKSARRYNKQTAHVEARRDGKPLVFGWGKHLSHTEKIRLQRRATWGLTAFILLLLAAVILGSWINLNIIVPGLAITTVNGHSIPQSEYRTMVAVKTQLELNKLYGPTGLTNQLTTLQEQDAQVSNTISQTNTQISSLNDQIKKLPAGPSTQRTALTKQLNDAQTTLTAQTKKHEDLRNQITNLSTNTIAIEKQGFTQSQIGNDSATWLQDDEVLREWLTTQSAATQAKINPTASQVNHDFNSLKANMPKSNGYNTFLSQMGISDDQIRSMVTIIDRRTNAQNYFVLRIATPSYQVLSRQIVVQTSAKANSVLQDLQKGQTFGSLAKQFSQDTNTNTKGGDLGWLTRYQYIDSAGLNGPAVVDNWLFDPARKLNEISPVLSGNGSYYIVQVMNIDPARTVDATLLKSLQGNALVDWLLEQRAQPGQVITDADQNKMFDAGNLPPNNILPSAAPSIPTPAAGLPQQAP